MKHNQPEIDRHKPSWKAVFLALCSRRMTLALVLGFSSGLPLLLTGSLLQAWMVDARVELQTIGLFALVGLPYTLKFLWAPLMDRYVPALGRRRGWLLIWQLALTASIVAIAFADPSRQLAWLALAALLLSFFSASQDIVIDAFRRETLADDEQGMGASLYVGGYRLGMLLASGGGLILADLVDFRWVYLIMAAAMSIGILATLLAEEPETGEAVPTTLKAAVIDPFREYFTRHHALAILLFIFLYKVGDTMAGQMTTPLYLDIGFSKTEIGTIVKLFGFWATIGGTLAGGILVMRLGLLRSLLGFGILQAVSTAGFIWLHQAGQQTHALAIVVSFENFSAGLGTAAFVGFIASLTDKRFTATQFALLTSFMGMPRVFAAAPTGYLAETLGWDGFFLLCTVVALPGLLLIHWLHDRLVAQPLPDSTLSPSSSETR